jgi:E-phenylitaconyl-CoA hydratase
MSIRFEQSGAIARITLNRPEKLNAMDSTTYRELDAAFEQIDADPEIRVAIVSGAGDRAFSAGADLKEMHGPESAAKGWGPWRPDGWSFGRTPRTPLIAAIQGFALAGGLELALTCDIRIATPDSAFGAPEVRWALLHGLGATRLPSVVGMSNAMSILMTGQRIDAQEALRMGLISKIVDTAELDAAATEIAEQIAANDPTAVQMSKELAMRAAYSTSDDLMRMYRSYFAILEADPGQPEAIAKFGERKSGS